MRRNLFTATLLMAMASLGQANQQPKTLVPIEDDPDWYREFVREMEALGCVLKPADEDGDIPFDVPRARLKEAMAVIEKYLTDESRAAYAKQRRPV